MAPVYIALGSNLGDRQANLRAALRLLGPAVRVEAVSALYESPPQPPAATSSPSAATSCSAAPRPGSSSAAAT